MHLFASQMHPSIEIVVLRHCLLIRLVNLFSIKNCNDTLRWYYPISKCRRSYALQYRLQVCGARKICRDSNEMHATRKDKVLSQNDVIRRATAIISAMTSSAANLVAK